MRFFHDLLNPRLDASTDLKSRRHLQAGLLKVMTQVFYKMLNLVPRLFPQHQQLRLRSCNQTWPNGLSRITSECRHADFIEKHKDSGNAGNPRKDARNLCTAFCKGQQQNLSAMKHVILKSQNRFLHKSCKCSAIASGIKMNNQGSSARYEIPGNSHQDEDDTDKYLLPALESVTPTEPPPKYVDIVPGKGPPPEPPVDCCMSGCANCVWIQYAEELKEYFSHEEGSARAKKAIEQIENPGLQMFLKLELGLL